MFVPDIPTISISDIIEGISDSLPLEVIAGHQGLARKVNIHYIQQLGLAVAGITNSIQVSRIQNMGPSELQYLAQLSPEACCEALIALPLNKIPAILITNNLEVPDELLEQANNYNLPILLTSEGNLAATQLLTNFLERRLAPWMTLHGVMIEVLGLGVILQGESGIGKSECALDLITKGFRLISDDVVEVQRIDMDIVCTAPELVRNYMEIRGLGILNIKDLFGISAIAFSCRLDLIIRFERWEPYKSYDRTGMDGEFSEILNKSVPMIRIPVTSGRNLATLVEVAVRNHLLKLRGINAVDEFMARHMAALDIDLKQTES